ncbi:MAG: hypothetical protein Q8P56_02240 [Candidatus Uhrbacteria bacterium]|nr:hypothetical protein [Candidatus Uhrbacteria bacterium]
MAMFASARSNQVPVATLSVDTSPVSTKTEAVAISASHNDQTATAPQVAIFLGSGSTFLIFNVNARHVRTVNTAKTNKKTAFIETSFVVEYEKGNLCGHNTMYIAIPHD